MNRYDTVHRTGWALLLTALLVLVSSLAGCQSGDNSAAQQSAVSQESTATELQSTPAGDSYTTEDLDAGWDDTATTITLNGASADITGNGASASDGRVTIAAAGTYVLNGSLEDGQILIDAGKDDLVRLVFNGVSLHSASGSPVHAKQARKIVLILADGTENTVSDTDYYTFDVGEDEPDATIFTHDDLSVTGNGSLTVTGNYRNAVASKDVLRITGGNLYISAVNDGLRGRDGLEISDGVFVVEAGNDGIKSNNDSDPEKGYVVLGGGNYTITSGHDAVQAETSLTINGGVYTVVTGGGAANASAQERADFFGRGGQQGQPQMQGQQGTSEEMQSRMQERQGSASRGELTQEELEEMQRRMQEQRASVTQDTAIQEEPADSDTSDSKKGFKAGTDLAVTGGSFQIDAADDAVHANGNLTVVSGSFAIQTGDDAFHADWTLTVNGGEFDIQTCYEGLEGSVVDINGGDIYINAVDDAINAAGGSDDTFTGGDHQVDDSLYIRITGGNIETVSGADSLDSNGHVYLEGGTLSVNGPTRGMDGAIICNGDIVVTGGSMSAVGSMKTPTDQTTQPCILISHKSEQAEGSVISLRNSDGQTVLEHTARKAFSSSAFTSPELVPGEAYTLFINGEKVVDITLDEAVTTLSDDGGAYSGISGGRGGFGGGMRGAGQ